MVGKAEGQEENSSYQVMTRTPIPLLIPHKMGNFNLSHKYITETTIFPLEDA